MKKQILLDMDGVLADFFSSALELLNNYFNKDITREEYILNYGEYWINNYFDISVNKFWSLIDNTTFWSDLKPFDWTNKLYKELSNVGEVTIVTSPSLNYECASQKLQWLDHYMNIKSNDVMIGNKKYLFAGNGILIDDSPDNCTNFEKFGGQAILVPSNWNTLNLTFDDIYYRLKRTNV